MKLKLVKKVNEATDTYSFFFETNEKINFLPGQYIYLTLPKLNYPDKRGKSRQFTLANSPSEKLLQITTRIRKGSGYKKTLNELKIGELIDTKPPMGSFVFPNHLSPNTYHLFLAGGIGITPFRSMIKYNIDKNLKVPIHLIYSNSNDEFVFKKELNKWAKENDFLKIYYHDSSILGHIDKLKIEKLTGNWKLKIGNSVLWTVGPPPFVSAMEKTLEELKVPEDNIKTEKFTGY